MALVTFKRTVALSVVAWSMVGCGTYHRMCLEPNLKPAEPHDVEVTFLGVGGFLIRYDGRALMTAPLYSNPTIGEVALQPNYSDHRLIDALLPSVTDVTAILSGHSHYDHLMDVPYVALKRADKAMVYGNDAMLKLLAPVAGLGGRLVSLEPLARQVEDQKLRCRKECPDAQGQLLPKQIRVWPILSEHSAQFKIPILPKVWFPPVQLWRGDLLEPNKELPSRVGDWVEGTVLAYLIDFLDTSGQNIDFRVYYQDSGTRKPFGFPPACILAQRPVDLALLCSGGSATVEGHPTEIVAALRPAFTLAGHWEDFLNPRELPLPQPCCGPKKLRCERINEVYGAKVKKFLGRLQSTLPPTSQYALPCPDAVTRFYRAGTVWRVRDSSEHWLTGKGSSVDRDERGGMCPVASNALRPKSIGPMRPEA